MRGKLLLLLVVCFHHLASAQASDTVSTADSTRYIINHISTGIANYTNDSRSYLLNNMLKFNIVRKNISINTTNGWIYGHQQTGLTNNDFTSLVDVSLFKTLRKLYYWGLITYDKSYSLKITDRLQSGLGVGYNLFTSPRFNLILSDGILYERTSLYDTTSYSTVRNSFRLKYHLVIGKIVTLNGINFWQQSFLTGEDYIIKFTNSISFRLQNWISFTITTTYNKLNISRTENFLCTAGFSFQKAYTHIRR